MKMQKKFFPVAVLALLIGIVRGASVFAADNLFTYPNGVSYRVPGETMVGGIEDYYPSGRNSLFEKAPPGVSTESNETPDLDPAVARDALNEYGTYAHPVDDFAVQGLLGTFQSRLRGGSSLESWVRTAVSDRLAFATFRNFLDAKGSVKSADLTRLEACGEYTTNPALDDTNVYAPIILMDARNGACENFQYAHGASARASQFDHELLHHVFTADDTAIAGADAAGNVQVPRGWSQSLEHGAMFPFDAREQFILSVRNNQFNPSFSFPFSPGGEERVLRTLESEGPGPHRDGELESLKLRFLSPAFYTDYVASVMKRTIANSQYSARTASTELSNGQNLKMQFVNYRYDREGAQNVLVKDGGTWNLLAYDLPSFGVATLSRAPIRNADDVLALKNYLKRPRHVGPANQTSATVLTLSDATVVIRENILMPEETRYFFRPGQIEIWTKDAGALDLSPLLEAPVPAEDWQKVSGIIADLTSGNLSVSAPNPVLTDDNLQDTTYVAASAATIAQQAYREMIEFAIRGPKGGQPESVAEVRDDPDFQTIFAEFLKQLVEFQEANPNSSVNKAGNEIMDCLLEQYFENGTIETSASIQPPSGTSVVPPQSLPPAPAAHASGGLFQRILDFFKNIFSLARGRTSLSAVSAGAPPLAPECKKLVLPEKKKCDADNLTTEEAKKYFPSLPDYTQFSGIGGDDPIETISDQHGFLLRTDYSPIYSKNPNGRGIQVTISDTKDGRCLTAEERRKEFQGSPDRGELRVVAGYPALYENDGKGNFEHASVTVFIGNNIQVGLNYSDSTTIERFSNAIDYQGLEAIQ